MAEAQGWGSAHASRLLLSRAKLRETFCNPFANANLGLRFNTDIYSKISKVLIPPNPRELKTRIIVPRHPESVPYS